MRFVVLILLFLFPAAGYGMEISDTLKASTFVNPDAFIFPLRVEVRAKSEGEVIDTLGMVDSAIRSLGLKYRGGVYTVEELREWDSSLKKYVKKGFRGSIHYRFILKEPREQSKILDVIEKLKGERGFIYSVESPHWEVSQGRKQMALEGLKRSLIEAAKREAQVFSDTLGKVCKLESVNFSPSYYYVPHVPLTKGIAGAPPMPAKSDQEVTLEASVKFKCE